MTTAALRAAVVKQQFRLISIMSSPIKIVVEVIVVVVVVFVVCVVLVVHVVVVVDVVVVVSVVVFVLFFGAWWWCKHQETLNNIRLFS